MPFLMEADMIVLQNYSGRHAVDREAVKYFVPL